MNYKMEHSLHICIGAYRVDIELDADDVNKMMGPPDTQREDVKIWLSGGMAIHEKTDHMAKVGDRLNDIEDKVSAIRNAVGIVLCLIIAACFFALMLWV